MTLEFHGPTYNWACHTLWLLDIHSCPPSAPGQLDPGLPRYGFLPPSQWRRGQEIQCNPQSFWPHLVVFDSGGPNTKKCWHEPSKEKKRSSSTVGLPWFTTFFQSLCEFRHQRLPFDSTSGFQCWRWVVQTATSRVPRRTPFGWQWNLQKAGFCCPQCTFDVPNYHGCNHTYRLRQYVVNIC